MSTVNSDRRYRNEQKSVHLVLYCHFKLQEEALSRTSFPCHGLKPLLFKPNGFWMVSFTCQIKLCAVPSHDNRWETGLTIRWIMAWRNNRDGDVL